MRSKNNVARMHSSHWGVFSAVWQDDRLVVTPHPRDPDPNDIIQNFPSALRHKARIDRPHIRRGWLERGPGKDVSRGKDGYVPVEWDEAVSLVATELNRIKSLHGPEAVFGGSYGWSSAGRFHHAQSQVHRFLNTCLGGYVRSVNSYSSGAASVILPHVLGNFEEATRKNVSWDEIVEHTEVVLAFGGMAAKNSRVAAGGISQHIERKAMAQARARGTEFILVSPHRADLPDQTQADWLPIIPGTDVAFMLGLAHTLVLNDLHDREFLASHCVGWEQFEDYLMGRADGQPKTAAWAEVICGLSKDEIERTARRIAKRRLLIVAAHAIQRARYGEQPVWMAAVLAAMLGQMGLPGGGYNYALGAVASYGKRYNSVPLAALPQGKNSVKPFIPVARISDMLLSPGQEFPYNGQTLRYPDIRLVYWAGGNPFHHHQDLRRLSRAFAGVDTFIVHEIGWTATAKHADIVLPCTMTIERNDLGGAPTDQLLVAMHQLAEPFGLAKDDYEIFSLIAERMGKEEQFTEGRSSEEWLRHLYGITRDGLIAKGLDAPSFDEFWEKGELELPYAPTNGGTMRKFRNDPKLHPLSTPSGKIEIFSENIASFGYDDCRAHPSWLGPAEIVTDDAPLFLLASQPQTRLHSQLDFGGYSESRKKRGREVVSIHPVDAKPRDLVDGDIALLSNAYGACLASVNVSEDLRPGVVQLPTGAWYDPQDPSDERPLCVHGNPNVLTRDIGTSSLAQGSCGQLSVVQVEKFTGNLPPIRAFDPPNDPA